MHRLHELHIGASHTGAAALPLPSVAHRVLSRRCGRLALAQRLRRTRRLEYVAAKPTIGKEPMIELEDELEKQRMANLARIDRLHSLGRRSDDHPTGECLTCGDGRRGVPCTHRKLSRQKWRFITRHIHEYNAIFTATDPAHASHLREMLAEEERNLSRGHVCNEPGGCPNENKARAIPPCPACRARWEALARQVCADCSKLPRQFRPKQCPACVALGAQDSAAVEIGRTSPVNPPAPLTIMLDYYAGNMG